jgi:hypothetical protein
VTLRSWPEIGSDGDFSLAPYVSKGMTGDDDNDDIVLVRRAVSASIL